MEDRIAHGQPEAKHDPAASYSATCCRACGGDGFINDGDGFGAAFQSCPLCAGSGQATPCRDCGGTGVMAGLMAEDDDEVVCARCSGLKVEPPFAWGSALVIVAFVAMFLGGLLALMLRA